MRSLIRFTGNYDVMADTTCYFLDEELTKQHFLPQHYLDDFKFPVHHRIVCVLGAKQLNVDQHMHHD